MIVSYSIRYTQHIATLTGRYSDKIQFSEFEIFTRKI